MADKKYIECEAAITILGRLRDNCSNDDMAFALNWASQTIQSISAADVRPVRHGRFLGTEYDGYADGNPVYYEWQCNVCGCIFEDDEPTYNFCPNCGADMRERS